MNHRHRIRQAPVSTGSRVASTILPGFACLLAMWNLSGAAAPLHAQAGSSGGLPESPIKELRILPLDLTMEAQSILQLEVQALDAQGLPLDGVQVRFNAIGGRFEGSVDPDGTVHSGSTGTIPISVAAFVPGTRPVVQRVEIQMVPGPAARVEITPQPARMAMDQRFRLSARVLSVHGDPRPDPVRWESSAPGIVSVTPTGLIRAQGPGQAQITARWGTVEESFPVEVVAQRIASVEVTPGDIEALQGDVVRFQAVARDEGGSVIPGLTPTWTFSPGHGQVESDGTFVAYEKGDYLITANFGQRSGDATASVEWREVRRPLTVLGRLPRTLFSTEEVWVHPDGKHAYLGTGSGGDRMYAVDISDPENPTVTDSLVANTRRVNDVMTTPDGRYLVHTREGAADRRNGIVIASLEDPAHPQVIAEFTDGVTSGVHSTFIYQQERFGTHIYLTNNGTGALHIVDISDPYNPREAGRWITDRPDAGRSLHDVDVQDGLAYLSYWNDGLVILDVGNGVKGGSPTNPQFVSQFKYDLNELYRDVEAVGGPGFIRGTHTAWRHNDYVFIADEVFPATQVRGAQDAAAGRAYGRMQVVDVSDLENPRSVAWYEPEFGGVHNLWAAGDTLYMGAYNGGFRVFDISGELRGDLRAGGREMGHLNTADMDGYVANSAMTWGMVVKDGLIYVSDMYNGLWIVRIEPREDRRLIP